MELSSGRGVAGLSDPAGTTFTLTAPNTPQPGETVVPSARVERTRIDHDDRIGVAWYALAVLAISLLIISIVVAA